VAAIAVYVDNTLAYKQNVQTLDTNITMSNGNHNLVVQFWDNSGNVPAKASVNITVSGTSSGQPTATLSANPTTISSGGTSTLTWSTTNATSVSIDQGIGTVAASGSMNVSPTQTTTYTLTATGSGATASATATVTVGSGGGGTCSPAGSAPSVTICSPTNGSTVTSPVHVVAVSNSNTGVVAMAVYFDNTLVYKTDSDSVDTTINAANGNHYVVVQYWDSHGNVPAKASENITVSGTSGGGGSGTGTVDVLTSHNDLSRDGANTNETILTPANVNPNQFGKIVGYGVDGQVYAQPLVVSDFSIGGATHDVLYVATEHDSVYAFDADNQTGTPYWSESLLGPGQTTVSANSGLGISPEVGITSTPVIDRGNNVMYVLAYVDNGGTLEFWLHALDLTSGAERFGGPARVTATVNGTGSDSSNGQITLEGGCWQRAGLAAANGNIYIGFGHCNHGWLLAYNASDLAQAAAYNTSPDGSGGTIWMGGGAPAVDSSGNIYVMTGTNFGDTQNSGFNDSFLKFSPSLSLPGYFQPSDNATLVQNDADLGSGGPMILPDNSSQYAHEIVGAGKDGRIFLLNRDNMGGYDPSANHVIQVIQSGSSQYNNFYDTPAFWNGKVYYHANGDVLRVFDWSNGLLSTSPVMTGATMFAAHGDSPSISSNGSSNGIVWELQNDDQPNGPTILHAYDANNVSQELWNSSMNSGDTAGPAVKFTVPTIANGKVYVPAGNQVDIYGPK